MTKKTGKKTERQNLAYELRQNLLRKHNFFALEDSDELYMYNDLAGIYENGVEPRIKQMLDLELDRFVKSNVLNETIQLLKARTYIPRAEIEASPNLLSVKNGVLDINTRELMPHSPDQYYIQQLPVYYHPNAKCPAFLKWLEESLDRKFHKLIQQEVGFTLKKRYYPKKAFIHVGDRHTSKTTYANLLVAFLGLENVATKSIQSICSRFGTVDLFGKTANICDENPSGALSNFDKFKALTGDSFIEGEIKGVQQKINFWNTAKMIFLCNKIPPVGRADDAYFSRWCIIPHTVHFMPGDPKTDPNQLDKLTTPDELSGLLNWALDGYDMLEKEGKLDFPDDPMQIRNLYSAYSDSMINRFIAERVRFDANARISKAAFYNEYVKYCGSVGAREEIKIYDNFYRDFWVLYNREIVEIQGSNLEGKRELQLRFRVTS